MFKCGGGILPFDKVIKSAFGDVLGGEVEHILIQVEEQWGDRKVIFDLQDRDIPDRSVIPYCAK